MLATKLHIPSTGTNLVHRTSLFDKLNQGLNRKLIFLSAPAGFGKTTALCDWIKLNNIPTAWYSIDNRDNDPAEFLNYIIAAIQKTYKDFGLTSLELLHAPHLPT
jgi:ATP/maltotriose-dependent transcriptional regulator MalT